MSEDDSLALRRSRRSTAGNRMEAALAEMAALQPEPEMEAEDDKDFVGPAEEEEIFDSDFQSTDEEAEQEEEAAGEKEIIAEEKQSRKLTRQRAVRAVEARSNALGLAPKVTTSADITTKPKRKAGSGLRRALVRESNNAKRGESSKRKSQRQSTMLSSQILNLRLKDAEVRKASMPKRVKESSVIYTQAELLARALDTEEGNIISHRNYLEDEEEKRKRARAVKQKLTGPVITWVSRLEDETVPVESLASNTPSVPTYSNNACNSQPGFGVQDVSTTADASGYSTYQSYGAAPLPSSYFAPSAALQALSQPLSTKTERVNKNYLLHRVDEGTPRPGWSETMTAVFGSHVNWEEVKVYSGKHRPLARPVQKCPITGKTAIYRDPRSGAPFAGVDAFRILSRLLSHEYVWNDELRCYTADEKAVQLEPESGSAVDNSAALSTS